MTSIDRQPGGDVIDLYLAPDTPRAPAAVVDDHTPIAEQAAPGPVATGELGPAAGESVAASWRVRLARHRARVRGQLGQVPDTRVETAKRRMHRAVELEQLAADPRAEAWSNRRVRAWMLAALAVFAAGGAILSAVFSALSVTKALVLGGLGWFVAAMGPDLLMGGLLSLGLVMRSITAQRGLTISPESHRAYRSADRWLGGLIAAITIGPSLGEAITAGLAWAHGGAAAGFGWALVSMAVHAIGPVVVVTSGALAPHITGDLARISQHTAQRLTNTPATSTNTTTPQATQHPPATSSNAASRQVSGLAPETSGNGDPVIDRARRELGTGVSGKQVARWHRAHIGPVNQARVGEIRDALNTTGPIAPAA
ncbi:hypothetical protein [Saccharopolyspora taberi]|uniref:Uncharacterized protein n=1 Tax=Saccharopolyspora taberi TaxID=60895 RepID=A0ABN3V4X4_9PSEU